MGISNGAKLKDGQLACTDFTRQEGAGAIQNSLEHQPLSAFQSYVVSEFAAEYLCPKQLPNSLIDLRHALIGGT